MYSLSCIRLVIIMIFLILSCSDLSSPMPFFSKLGLFSPKRAKIPPDSAIPTVTMLVEIPVSSMHYTKPIDVKAGGRFTLETPMEQYAYSSAGRSNLQRVKIAYLVQSMYRPNHMCFFLHFWSMKDPTVPWGAPRAHHTTWIRRPTSRYTY
ncbi:unnamed protein product [Orchesella dallaii]|uniref:Uncharacterized protein n=1 Tax=Orchesella dallaii TaxID=48710 RepID=A0ABP1QU22_9HEXA